MIDRERLSPAVRRWFDARGMSAASQGVVVDHMAAELAEGRSPGEVLAGLDAIAVSVLDREGLPPDDAFRAAANAFHAEALGHVVGALGSAVESGRPALARRTP